MTIRDVILRYRFFAHGGNPEAAVDSWEATVMEAHEVEEWLAARYFAPDAAALDLADAGRDLGHGPHTNAGGGQRLQHVDTVGFRAANGDLGTDEARELVAAF